MPDIPNITNITPPRVPLTDQRTGLISREWYRFFLSLFTLTGSGSNTASLTDLQVGPPVQPVDLTTVDPYPALLAAYAMSQAQESQIAELQKQLNGFGMTPQNQLGTLSAIDQANVPWLTFNTSPSPLPTAVGSMYWDGGTTLGLQMTANVLGRVNEDLFYYIKASSAITKGQVVMFTGSVGASGVVKGAPATGVTDGSYIMGVAAESIALNGFGLVQYNGTMRGLNTSAFSDGDILWYNPAVTGGLTNTKPTAPNVKVQMAAVINAGSGGSGSILIRVDPGSILGGTDANVQFGTLSNNDLIQYDSALQYWKNVAPSSVTVGTATNLAGGAAGSLPFQTSSGTTSMLALGTSGYYLKANASAPAWTAPAALTKTDDTNVTLTLGGSASTALLNAASLTLGWTGQLAIGRGGTGVSTTPSNGQLLIGNGTGYTVANLTAGTGVSISNSAGGITISATGTGGTVTSVGLSMPSQFTVTNSPVTSSGTLTAAWNSQTANYVLAGPTTGAAAAPTFRALVAADIPSLSYVSSVSGTSGRITSSGGLTPTIDLASGVVTPGTTGSATLIPVITVDTYGRVTSVTTAANPQGTVTSVAMTVPSFLSVSGSPITSSGTLAVSLSGTALPTANGGTNVTSSGTSGSILVSNGTNWTTNTVPAFNAYNNAVQTISATTLTKIAFNATDFDTASYFDTANNRYKPLVAGYYNFQTCVVLNTGSTSCVVILMKNGSIFKYLGGGLSTGSYNSMGGSTTVYANGSTDYFEISIYEWTGLGVNTTAGSSNCWFSGSLVRGA